MIQLAFHMFFDMLFFEYPFLAPLRISISFQGIVEKKIFNKICSYCKKDAFRKTICTSGAPIFVTHFFKNSNSFFISVWSVQQIFMSILVGKLIFQGRKDILEGHCKQDFESVCTPPPPPLLPPLFCNSVVDVLVCYICRCIAVMHASIFSCRYTKDHFQSFLARFLVDV